MLCSVYSLASFWRMTGSSFLSRSLARAAERLRGRAPAATGTAGTDLAHVIADPVLELLRRSDPANAEPTAPEPPVPRPARSAMSVVLATAQPLFRPPMMSSSCTRALVDEHLVEHRVAGHFAQRSGLDAGLGHVEAEVRDALVLRQIGVGACDQHADVAELRGRGPHLLTRDDPLVTVLDRFRPEAREVGTGARFGEQLAPRVLPVEDVQQVLLSGARCRARRSWARQAGSRGRRADRSRRARRSPRSLP